MIEGVSVLMLFFQLFALFFCFSFNGSISSSDLSSSWPVRWACSPWWHRLDVLNLNLFVFLSI
jgi:hypothetical protein